MLGYTSEEMLKLNVADWDAQWSGEELLTKIHDVIATPAVFETRQRKKDGTYIDAEINATGVNLEGHNYIYAAARDITERKQTEEKLRANEAQYHSMFETNTAIKLLLDPSTGAIIEANQAAASFYHWSIDQLETMNIDQINTLSDEEIKAEMKIASRQERTYFNFRHRLASGEIRDVEVHSSPIEIKGRKLLFSIIHDISDRKKAEAALLAAHAELEQRVMERTAELNKANQALEKALRARDEFTAAMSHELRTPLTGVLGLSQVMQMPAYGPLTEKQLKAVVNIEQSGQRLLSVVNDVLDYSMLQSGSITSDPKPCSLEYVCRTALRAVSAVANPKKQQTHFSIQPEQITINVDERRLNQAISHLLHNANKFTPPEGEFGIEVRGEPELKIVAITIWDTGIGIRPEDQPRLFQPFVQLDASLARKYEGSGLGLALVKQISELLGASVTVESEVGKGSRFTITLPWNQ